MDTWVATFGPDNAYLENPGHVTCMESTPKVLPLRPKDRRRLRAELKLPVNATLGGLLWPYRAAKRALMPLS